MAYYTPTLNSGDVLPQAAVQTWLISVDAGNINAGVAITGVVMVFNTFICPAPGTDWTPQVEGVALAASKTAKKFWIPLSGLKIGDIITTYNIVGDVVEVAAATFDCKLVRVNKANPLTTTDITNGAITQVIADGNFDSQANCDDETVATDKAYVLECQGTTGVGDAIIVTHAEVTITRILKP